MSALSYKPDAVRTLRGWEDRITGELLTDAPISQEEYDEMPPTLVGLKINARPNHQDGGSFLIVGETIRVTAQFDKAAITAEDAVLTILVGDVELELDVVTNSGTDHTFEAILAGTGLITFDAWDPDTTDVEDTDLDLVVTSPLPSAGVVRSFAAGSAVFTASASPTTAAVGTPIVLTLTSNKPIKSNSLTINVTVGSLPYTLESASYTRSLTNTVYRFYVPTTKANAGTPALTITSIVPVKSVDNVLYTDASITAITLTLNKTGLAPRVVSAGVPKSSPVDVAFGTNVDISVVFDEAMTVANTPTLQCNLKTAPTAANEWCDSVIVSAPYLSGSGTATLVFRYTPDTDEDYHGSLGISGFGIDDTDTIKNSQAISIPTAINVTTGTNILPDLVTARTKISKVEFVHSGSARVGVDPIQINVWFNRKLAGNFTYTSTRIIGHIDGAPISIPYSSLLNEYAIQFSAIPSVRGLFETSAIIGASTAEADLSGKWKIQTAVV